MEPRPKPPSIVQTPLTWSSAIGLFMLNFGTLEMLVFTYLEKKLTAEEFEKIRTTHFKDRAERVGDLFAKTAEQRAAYDAFLQHLAPVRELRNHLAHGFLRLVIHPGDQGHAMAITQAKDLGAAFSSETKHLEFSELTTSLGQLTAVTDEFRRLTDKEAGWSEQKEIQIS